VNVTFSRTWTTTPLQAALAQAGIDDDDEVETEAMGVEPARVKVSITVGASFDLKPKAK